jgi:uncharacterized protein YbjT (DUF2867 family)
MILVTGAAGKTGRAVVDTLRRHDQTVRALVHSDEQQAELEVEDTVTADLLKPKQVLSAFRDVRAVYHICPNVHPQEVEIGQNVLKAARESEVELFVLHSVLHPQIQAMPHHWNKLLVEEMLLESGLRFSILQPASYMQNVLSEWWRVRLMSQYHVPYSIEAEFSPVDLLDVAEVAASVLTTSEHQGATYELVGPEVHTPKSMAGELGEALGKLAMAVEVDRKEWEEHTELEKNRKELLLRMFEYYDEHGLWGNARVLRDLLGREPTRFREFANRLVREASDL